VPSIAVSGADFSNTAAQTVQSYYPGFMMVRSGWPTILGGPARPPVVNAGWLSGIGVGLRYSNRVKSPPRPARLPPTMAATSAESGRT
jgi:hypothetical protein